MRHIYLFTLSLCLALGTHAETPPEVLTPLELSRQGAVEYALAHNLGLAAARTTVDQATARHSQAGAWENPVLNLEVASDFGLTDEGQYAYSVGFEQQFPITNRLQLLKGIAAIEVHLAEAEILNQERLLAKDVASLAVTLAVLDAQVELREELIALNQRSADFLSNRVESGEASVIDVNQLKVALYALEQEVLGLRSNSEEMLVSLKILMGLPPEQDLIIVTELALPPQLPSLPAVDQGMLEKHPEYQLKQLLYQVANKQTSLALAERWADIAVEVFYEQDHSVDQPFGLTNDSYFGIGLSIPLPIHNQNRGEIEASRAYRRQVEHELEAVSLRIRSTAKVYQQRAARLYAQAVDYNVNVTHLVQQNLSDMNTAYSAGQIDLTTLFRTQEQVLKIESSQLILLRDYLLAHIAWEAATARNLYPNLPKGNTLHEQD